jgi:TBC domain-containing protein kinase-like protein
MRRFIRAFPFEKERLKFEASKDIPPAYRAQIWAALLDVFVDDTPEDFAYIDCISEQISDRQLQVDIPRCHQYDELMLTSAAHYKLKQILKSWLWSEKKYTYWQGLDSLAAPFLYLNFNNVRKS